MLFMPSLTPKALVRFLRTKNKGFGLLDKLKITYRPYICPFHSLLSHIQPGDHIVDIGCGCGQFALLAAEFCTPKTIVGIEIDEKLIAKARALCRNIHAEFRFDTYDGLHIPEDISLADVVFMIDVVHHIPNKNRKQLINNIHRQMRVGAMLIIKEIDAASFFVEFNRLHDRIINGLPGDEATFEELQDLLKCSGFNITAHYKQRMLLYPHMTVMAIKN